MQNRINDFISHDLTRLTKPRSCGNLCIDSLLGFHQIKFLLNLSW